MIRKKIQCKECGKECYTGQRSMCSYCYKGYLALKAKNAKKESSLKAKKLKVKEKKAVSKTAILTAIQKLVRVCSLPICITCKVQPSGTNFMTGGHFISRRKNSTCYLVHNINPQCSYCNADQSTSGKSFIHGHEIDLVYPGLSLKLWKISQLTYKFNSYELSELKTKVNEALKSALSTEDLDERAKILEEFKNYQEQTNWYKAFEKLI